MVELFESKALLQVADTEADEHLEGVLENAASTHDASRAAPSSYSDWEIDSEQLKLDRELGRGGKFGRCFGGEWRGTPCTVKVIHDTKSPKPRAVFVREVENMARLHHPHIVQFLGFCAISGDAGTQLWLVMEHFSRGRRVDAWLLSSVLQLGDVMRGEADTSAAATAPVACADTVSLR
jgi:hypothetical protein